MKYKINWNNIKNGYKGFEALAVKYVQMEYDSNFKKTADTRDGNKDAILEKEIYTVILGYQPSSNASEEWWMEAKYSDSKDVIPRYRLDATLVSAILKGNVGRIIFVTNMTLKSQTINDIRQAITGVSVCKEVNFCTRNTLEFWLYQNPEILSNYFPDYQNENIELENLILIDNIMYYSAPEMNYTYKESIRVLELEQKYRANFAVFSKGIQTFSLQANKSIKGIKIINPKKVILQNGINNIQFNFILKRNYGYRSVKKQQEHMMLPEPEFLLGSLQLVSENGVTVNKQILTTYEILSQNNMQKKIFNFFSKATQDSTCLFYLYGQSGVGKSHVLNKYISSHNNCLCFYCEMSGSNQHDLKNLVDCINYIYFPFVPSEGITAEYLNHISNNNYFPYFYQEMIAYRDDEMQLSQIIVKYISEDISLFPKKMYLKQRNIIIDNIHKATNTIINFLYKMVIEQSMVNAPFRIIFSGQWIQHTDIYRKLQVAIEIEEQELLITANDCLNILSNHTYDNRVKDFLASNQLFSNVVELLIFSIYLCEHNKVIQDFETFQIVYHMFFREHIMDIYMKRIFDNAVLNDEKASQLCNQVYWNPHGISRTDSQEERKLLQYHVIKLNSTAQQIIPYHDLYAKCYRKNYIYNQLANVPFMQLLQFGNYSDILSMVNKLDEEYKKKNYTLVYYTLEPLFKDASSNYRNLIDDTMYFTLFMDFAHSCAFCSIDYSGGILFERIYNETKLLYNPTSQLRLVHNAALWELTNSTFESLKYEQALTLCDELVKDTKKLVACGIMNGKLEDITRYHNTNVIKSMIKSEMQEEDNIIFFQESVQKMKEYKQENRLWSFYVRYSLTLMQQNPQEALKLLQACFEHYKKFENKSEKYYLWSCFYISYLKMIIEDDFAIRYSEETNALTILEEIKDLFFNDYRKMLYGIVLYLYYCGRKDEADLYLLKDCYVLRDKRPRLKGFEHLVFALRHIIEKENTSALNELKKAYTIFKHIPSYSSLIQHNIILIENNKSKTFNQIKYYLGGTLEKDVYYLDIRGCW